MQLGDILVAQGLVTPNDVEHAIAYQNENGGRLSDCLLALNLITEEKLSAVLHSAPSAPKTLQETGISQAALLKLLVKTMYVGSLELPSEASKALRLPPGIVLPLLKEGISRRFFEILGANGAATAELRYVMTETGRSFAVECLNQSQYVGPAPISLAEYTDRVQMQSISNERISPEEIVSAFSTDLVVSEEFIRKLGPGVNSGRAILLYGPPGNGKTSVAEKVGNIFKDVIYVPYCIDVDGQIIKIFDPAVHIPASRAEGEAVLSSSKTVRKSMFDQRYVAIRRPIIITGGELTLEMLDLKFNEQAMFYEAPLHMKALNGTFIIDDFGRQLVNPEDLLNRWIVPLQNRIDYLKLHTGKSFSTPFDELIIFSTNMSPDDLMDPAFLRRIPYKLETTGPSNDAYYRIFDKVAADRGLQLTQDVFNHVIAALNDRNFDLACYQPKFIIDQVVSACKFNGVEPHFTNELIDDALSNLYTKDAAKKRLAEKMGGDEDLLGSSNMAA